MLALNVDEDRKSSTALGGCTIKVLYFHIVPRVVYSHIFGSIRSSNLAYPHPFIRGCGSAILLDRIEVYTDIEHGLDPCVV